MALKLVFLGRLEDLAGAGEMEILTVSSLAEVLAGLEPELAAALNSAKVRLAVNGKLVADRGALMLRDGDELAFLPPVSGG
ncbi:MAG: MoaD/ThiS family protein [Novosphingobium sp.]|nr:MoaD/ThiS family protein [Novosphingobium sp.]